MEITAFFIFYAGLLSCRGFFVNIEIPLNKAHVDNLYFLFAF